MPDLILFDVEAGQRWQEAERTTVLQAALDIGNAVLRETPRILEKFPSLEGLLVAAGNGDEPAHPIEPATAFLRTFGNPVVFLRKATADPNGAWGFARSRSLVWIHKNAIAVSTDDRFSAISNRPQFTVHELGHVFENVIADALGVRKGRDSLPPRFLFRRKPTTTNDDGFFLLRRFQQSQDLGRGEIFADMFIGWVYDRWRTNLRRRDETLTKFGADRKLFMDEIMIDLLQAAILHNHPIR
jgi:hypothetical protein